MKSIGSISLKEHVANLKQSAVPFDRALIADQIGALLEHALQDPVSIDSDGLRAAFIEMTALALKEADREAKESLLHALVNASSLACARHKYVDPEPIARALDGFSEAELEYGLYILGFSRNHGYRPTIARFLEHPDSHIRAVAQQALQELEWR